MGTVFHAQRVEVAMETAERHGAGRRGEDGAILEVRNLKKYFPIQKGIFRRETGWVKAVDDVSFRIGHGETLGLVGESGSGKTTTGRTILRAIEPTAGQVLFQLSEGEITDFTALGGKELRAFRIHAQMIFKRQ